MEHYLNKDEYKKALKTRHLKITVFLTLLIILVLTSIMFVALMIYYYYDKIVLYYLTRLFLVSIFPMVFGAILLIICGLSM